MTYNVKESHNELDESMAYDVDSSVDAMRPCSIRIYFSWLSIDLQNAVATDLLIIFIALCLTCCSFKTTGDDGDSIVSLRFTSLGGYFVAANASGSMSVYKCGDGNNFSRILVADGEGRRKVVNIESVHRFVNSSRVTTSTWIKSDSLEVRACHREERSLHSTN